MLLGGCGKQLEEPKKPENTYNAFAGCGSCIYKMPGVKGCKTAVKVEDKTKLLAGVEYNAHSSGLCDAEKKAVVTGYIDGDRFVASAIKVSEK